MSTELKMVYLERFDSYTSFVLLLHHFNELANNLVSHIINVSTALKCKNKQDPIYRRDVVNPNQRHKVAGEQPTLYLADRKPSLLIQPKFAVTVL